MTLLWLMEKCGVFVFFCQTGREWTEQWTEWYISLLYSIHSCLLWNVALNPTGNDWNLDFPQPRPVLMPFEEQINLPLNKYASNPQKLLCSRIPFFGMSLTLIIHYFSWWKIILITVCIYYIYISDQLWKLCPFIRVKDLVCPYMMKPSWKPRWGERKID